MSYKFKQAAPCIHPVSCVDVQVKERPAYTYEQKDHDGHGHLYFISSSDR